MKREVFNFYGLDKNPPLIQIILRTLKVFGCKMIGVKNYEDVSFYYYLKSSKYGIIEVSDTGDLPIITMNGYKYDVMTFEKFANLILYYFTKSSELPQEDIIYLHNEIVISKYESNYKY